MNRRTFLATHAAALASLSFAGCTGGGGGGGDGGGGETTTVTQTATATESGDGGDGASDESDGTTFTMRNFKFVPDLMRIDAGTTVTWTIADPVEHSVQSASFSEHAVSWNFDSGTMAQGDTVEYTFEEEGVYHFACGVHGESTGCGAILVGVDSLPGDDIPCTDLNYE